MDFVNLLFFFHFQCKPSIVNIETLGITHRYNVMVERLFDRHQLLFSHLSCLNTHSVQILLERVLINKLRKQILDVSTEIMIDVAHVVQENVYAPVIVTMNCFGERSNIPKSIMFILTWTLIHVVVIFLHVRKQINHIRILKVTIV